MKPKFTVCSQVFAVMFSWYISISYTCVPMMDVTIQDTSAARYSRNHARLKMFGMQALAAHIRSVHTNIRPYKCEECGKRLVLQRKNHLAMINSQVCEEK